MAHRPPPRPHAPRASFRFRRAYQKNALRHSCAQAAVRFRITQERDDLFELELCFLYPCHILECNFCIRLDVDLGAGFSDRHQPADSLLFGKAAKDNHPDHVEDDGRHDPGEDGLNKTARRSALDHHPVLRKLVCKLRVDADREKFALAAWQWRFH